MPEEKRVSEWALEWLEKQNMIIFHEDTRSYFHDEFLSTEG